MNTILTNVVEQEVLERMRAKGSFTALDISNALKVARYPFRHREVAGVVRDIYESGAMDCFDYRRQLIAVLTEGGAKTAQAYLYCHQNAHSSEYADRDQTALPPVPSDQARDLSDCVAAGPLPILPRPRAVRAPSPPARRSSWGRRDGALAIPRRLLALLHWDIGKTLAVHAEPGRLTLRPETNPDGHTLRVWGGQRARVCKTTLRLGLLTADLTLLEIVGDGLRIASQTPTPDQESLVTITPHPPAPSPAEGRRGASDLAPCGRGVEVRVSG